MQNQERKHVLIGGTGDAAFDYALNLAEKRNSVTILNRDRDVKCLQLLWERAQANPAIYYREGISVIGVDVWDTADTLRVRCETGEELEADYLLFAIGRLPQLDFPAPDFLDREQKFKGLHFAGDVKNGPSGRRPSLQETACVLLLRYLEGQKIVEDGYSYQMYSPAKEEV